MTKTELFHKQQACRDMLLRHAKLRRDLKTTYVETEVAIRMELAAYQGQDYMCLSDEECGELSLDWLVDRNLRITRRYNWIGPDTCYLVWGKEPKEPDTRLNRLKNRWRKWLINTFEPMPF